ncbi:MAG TPA: YggS family pyridoxal phosphate-dependent enzyme [Holophagaceae bacterium]|nr:YggS family pyridoxal phosphate-dependent enzyme [Geothrix sp.]HJW33168.1 YggS family pyridoxal phosphate-dependent enzyme [Holophagaceae bacterium]
MSLQARVQQVRDRLHRACLAAGRKPEDVELLPVSKRQPESLIREAMALGFRRFGENYVQEAATKAASVPAAELILIGPLQSNKAKAALQTFAEIQSVDRLELAQRLDRLAGELALVRPTWVQVDLWNEDTKMGGCPAERLPELVAFLAKSPRLPFQGFMAIPPPEDAEAFQQLARLRETWSQNLGRKVKLSMGMSADLESAVDAGSDQIRVGTAFFGAR